MIGKQPRSNVRSSRWVYLSSSLHESIIDWTFGIGPFGRPKIIPPKFLLSFMMLDAWWKFWDWALHQLSYST